MTRMFQKIQDLIDDKDALVFVLIDEVGVLRRHTCERRKRRTGWPSALPGPPARACPAPQAAPCRPSPGPLRPSVQCSHAPASPQLTTLSLCAHRWKA